MAVVDSTGAADPATNAGPSIWNPDGGADLDRHPQPAAQPQKGLPGAIRAADPEGPVLRPHQDPVSFQMRANRQLQPLPTAGHGLTQRSNGGIGMNGVEGGFKRDMKDLEDLLSKLNPMAEEFVPPSLRGSGGGGLYPVMHDGFVNSGGTNWSGGRLKKHGYNQGKRRMNSRTSQAQRAERIRKTVYVSDIDQSVTEEELAALFHHCGQVMDCRVCCDPNSVLRFAFIEFENEDGARTALDLSGTVLGYYPVRVLPSKTAIAPIDPKFIPKTADEREMCTRTIYCTNIDRKVTQTDLKLFFEEMCGEVHRLRLLGDYQHSTRIAFVEFARAECAIAAINSSGSVLGSLPLRVSPSKTPVFPRAPRPPMH